MKHVPPFFTDLSAQSAETFARRRALVTLLTEHRASLATDLADLLDDLVTGTAGPEIFEPDILGYMNTLLLVLDNEIALSGGAPTETRAEDGSLCLFGGSKVSRRLYEVRKALAALAEAGWRVADGLAAEAALETQRKAFLGS